MELNDYLEATRTFREDVADELVACYEENYQKLIDILPAQVAEEEIPGLCVVKSLNKSCDIVDVGSGPVIVIDQYLGQTLNELTAIFFGATVPDTGRMLTFRLISEQFSLAGKDEEATYMALCYSVAYNDAERYKEHCEFGLEGERFPSIKVQETYLLAHEMAHFLWSTGHCPNELSKSLAEFVLEEEQPKADLDELVSDYLDDLAFQFHGKPISHEESLQDDEARAKSEILKKKLRAQFEERGRATLERTQKRVTDMAFIEELWADWYAARCCLKIFIEDMPLEVVLRAIHLAMENMTTLNLVVMQAEDIIRVPDEGKESFEYDVALRKRTLRRILADLVSDTGASEAGGITTDPFGMLREANIRYMRFVRDPITLDAMSAINEHRLPKPEILQALHESFLQTFGEDPAYQLIARTPITSDQWSRIREAINAGANRTLT